MTPGYKRLIVKLLILLPGALLPGLGLPNATLAAGLQRVSYDGVTVSVPMSWPVIRVSSTSPTCVRFNRHAVYLGTPGGSERCPQNVVGRTEAILLEPAPGSAYRDLNLDGRSGALTPTSTALAAGTAQGDSMVRILKRRQRVIVTATWNRDPQLIAAALHLHSLAVAARATNGHRPAVEVSLLRRHSAGTGGAPTSTTTTTTPTSTTTTTTTTTTPTSTTPTSAPTGSTATTAATPGGIYTGLGFDTCSAPSVASLAAWAAGSPYHALGIYIGGTNMGCAQTNLSSTWVSAESTAGWHLIPTYVGLQAPGACSGCAAITGPQAAAEGAAAAQDAVYQAQALGIGSGNPIYYDMEAYNRAQYSSMVLSFLSAWTAQLHASGYLSGVYSSSASGITDLVDAQGTSGFLEPDDIWFAHWDTPANTTDSYVPAADWANDQRVHQYAGGHNETYDGVKLNIDNDYLTAATAAAGSAAPLTAIASAPTVSVQPQPDGSIEVAPTWSGETGVASWVISGGPSATSLTPIETVPASQTLPLVLDDDDAYFSATALSSTGAIIGSSPPTQTPASVAIYTNSVFSPNTRAALVGGTIAVPVGCLNTSPCSLQAAIYTGKKRLAHSAPQTVLGRGGTIRLPVTTGVLRALAAGVKRQVSVRVTAGTGGLESTRTIELVPYSTSGPTPTRKTGSSASLSILAKTAFVSNGWVGGVLVRCKAAVPCTATTSVMTRSGHAIAVPRTQTIGSGQIAYLLFRLTVAGHALLRSSYGNQFPARVTVTTQATTGAAAASTAATGSRALALIALASYH